MGMEIERKFLVKAFPENPERFPYHEIVQGYLCRHPAVRVRREDDRYYMTYKGLRQAGQIGQEEYNLPLSKEAFDHLLAKADGRLIEKRRVLIPLNADAFSHAANADAASWAASGEGQIELDVFSGEFEGLQIAEVEFPSEEIAAAYHPADWFGREVTGDEHYSNAWLALSERN